MNTTVLVFISGIVCGFAVCGVLCLVYLGKLYDIYRKFNNVKPANVVPDAMPKPLVSKTDRVHARHYFAGRDLYLSSYDREIQNIYALIRDDLNNRRIYVAFVYKPEDSVLYKCIFRRLYPDTVLHTLRTNDNIRIVPNTVYKEDDVEKAIEQYAEYMDWDDLVAMRQCKRVYMCACM